MVNRVEQVATALTVIRRNGHERSLACLPRRRVLGDHRYEIGNPVVSGEAGEQGDADVHHALGLRDHDGALPEAGEPMSLAGVVPLDAVGLVLARIELPDRQEYVIHGVVVRTVQARAPARQPLNEALTGGFVTTAAFPVHQLPCRTIPSFPDPERFGLFFRSCHISSSSITTARPSGSGFWAEAAANCSSQAWMVGVETPSSLAVRAIDRPLT